MSMKLYVVVFSAIAIVTVARANPALKSSSDIKALASMVNNMPATEKHEFLKYHLTKGFQLKKEREGVLYPKAQVELTEDQQVLLYEYFLQNNKITDAERTAQVNDTVCFPEGCIDIDDPGFHPM